MTERLRRTAVTWTSYAVLGYFGYLVAALGPVVAFLRHEQDLSYARGSLHFSAFAAGVVLAGVVGHRPVRRFGRAASLAAGVMGMSAAAALITIPSPAVTLVSAVGLGIFGGLMLSGATSTLSRFHHEQRATALTEANVAACMFAIVAPLLIGALAATAVGWRSGVLIAVVAAPALLLFLRRLSSAIDTRGGPGTSGGEATGDSADTPGRGRLPARYWTFWVLLFLVDAIEFSVVFWAAPYLEHATSLSRPGAAAGVSIFIAGMLVGRLGGARLTRRPGREVPLLLAALVVAAVGFAAYRLPMAGLVAIAGLFVIGLGVANLWPLALALAVGTSPDRLDAAAARSSLAAGLAILIAPFVLGWLADRVGIIDAHWIVPVLLVAAAATLAAATWPDGRRDSRRSVEDFPSCSSHNRPHFPADPGVT